MTQVTFDEFLKLFDEGVHDKLRASLTRKDSTHVVCFENQDFCSSHLGDRSALGIGPNNSYKVVAEVEGRWFGDLPSQRLYPTVWAVVPETLRGSPEPEVQHAE